MKYIVLVQSSVVIEAGTAEEVIDQIDDMREDAQKRNCGDIGDEMLASAAVVRIEKDETDDE